VESNTSRYLHCLAVCWLAGSPSIENTSDNPCNGGVRDGNRPAGGSGRDGSGSIELQRDFAAASEGRRDVRSTEEE